MIWHKLFVKFGVLFDVMVCSKEVFSESIHRIETHLDLFVENIEVQISIAFKLCLYEQFISFWWDDIMFEITNYTNLCISSTLQLWSLIVIWYQSFKILGLWWVQLVWWGVLIQNHKMCNNCLDLSKIIACMMRSWSSTVLPILFCPLGFMKLEWWSTGSHKLDGGYESLVLFGTINH